MKDEANRTVQTEQRRLAAIMFTDIVGFSRQMGIDEAHTLICGMSTLLPAWIYARELVRD